MKCQLHPSAPASANCAKCQIPLCGFCSTVVAGEVYCERCGDNAQLESFVAQRSTKKQEKVGALLAEAETTDSQTPAFRPTVKSKTATREKLHIGIVLVCSLLIAFQLYTSFSGPGTLTAQQIIAEDRTRNQIEACMLVFWQIAEVLAAGRTPGENLRCEETGLPMNVATVDGDLRISHPRPDLLGLTEIYVTRSNPIPVVVE
jgi:uncharacterized Zn finger protein (UPF0148 family)